MTVKSMKTSVLPGLVFPLRSTAARLLRDDRGNSAVEFAVVLPVMLVMFFGTIELSSAVALKRKISVMTQAVGDLTSRYTNVNDTDMTNFGKIADAMMTPYSATPLKSTVTEIYIDPSTGVARAQWSKGDNPRGTGSTVPVPANLIARDASNKIVAGQYLIFSEASYIYTPIVGYVMKTAVTLSDQTYMRPRLSQCVLYNATSGSCPTS
jgi:Flp pilus assembly protein TadG